MKFSIYSFCYITNLKFQVRIVRIVSLGYSIMEVYFSTSRRSDNMKVSIFIGQFFLHHMGILRHQKTSNMQENAVRY